MYLQHSAETGIMEQQGTHTVNNHTFILLNFHCINPGNPGMFLLKKHWINALK